MGKIEKPLYRLERIEICRNCQGMGTVRTEAGKNAQCFVCEGAGRVRVQREIKITIQTL